MVDFEGLAFYQFNFQFRIKAGVQTPQQHTQSVEYRQDNDQGSGSEGNTRHGEERNDIDKILLSFGQEIAPGDEEGEIHELNLRRYRSGGC